MRHKFVSNFFELLTLNPPPPRPVTLGENTPTTCEGGIKGGSKSCRWPIAIAWVSWLRTPIIRIESLRGSKYIFKCEKKYLVVNSYGEKKMFARVVCFLLTQRNSIYFCCIGY